MTLNINLKNVVAPNSKKVRPAGIDSLLGRLDNRLRRLWLLARELEIPALKLAEDAFAANLPNWHTFGTPSLAFAHRTTLKQPSETSLIIHLV